MQKLSFEEWKTRFATNNNIDPNDEFLKHHNIDINKEIDDALKHEYDEYLKMNKFDT